MHYQQYWKVMIDIQTMHTKCMRLSPFFKMIHNLVTTITKQTGQHFAQPVALVYI